MPLNDKQRRFVWEYCVDHNATAAYIRAGYASRGAAARANASRLLTDDNVQSAINERLAEIDKRTHVDAEKVRKELARLGFTDMRKFVKWGPDGVQLLPSDELSEDDSPAVTEVVQTPGQYGDTLKIKLGHKDSALRMLAEHTGLIGGRDSSVNVNVNVDANRKNRTERYDALFDQLDAYRAGHDEGSSGRTSGESIHPGGSHDPTTPLPNPDGA